MSEEFEVILIGDWLYIKEGDKEISIGCNGERMRKLKEKIAELDKKL